MAEALSSKSVLLAGIYLLGVLLLLPPYRWRWPDAEEWGAILWPVVIAALLLIILVSSPFFAWNRAREFWKSLRVRKASGD